MLFHALTNYHSCTSDHAVAAPSAPRAVAMQGLLPTITSLSPFCLPASGKGRVLVQGRHILGPGRQVYCRHKGDTDMS